MTDYQVEEIAYASGKEDGREEMKEEILAIIKTYLVRDPTLQKLAKQINELESGE